MEEGNESTLSDTYWLWQNAPNPFNAATTIRYLVPRTGSIELVVYDILGRRVRTLVQDSVPAGIHTIAWDSRNDRSQPIASGVYFYLFRADGFFGRSDACY